MKYFLIFFLVFSVSKSNAQSNAVQINQNLILPKDSLVAKKLLASLNSFLVASQKANAENAFVHPPEKIETFIELDELKGIEKSGKFNDEHFYKPQLNNVVLLKDNNYFIQLSYIGAKENEAYLRASFEFIAHKNGDSFTFSSPLLYYTQNWKVLKSGKYIFHYRNTINEQKVKEYTKLTETFDAKLKVPEKITDYYLCNNVVELNKLFGVSYKLDYNAQQQSYSTSDFGHRKLVVYGMNNADFSSFDPHDLFHDRLSLVIPRSKVNKPVDEGCAYLYGGSWGFTWKEIFKAFKEKVANNKDADWVAIKENDIRFPTGKFTNSADNVVNALLVQKIEKEKGFAGVWEMLNVGPAQKGNEKYYQTLEKLTGINKANYNQKVWELIRKEK